LLLCGLRGLCVERADFREQGVFSTTDTIVAIATPPGRGGIGVVRLSGRDAHEVARRLITHQGALEPRHATFTLVRLKPDTTYRTPDTTPQTPDTDSPDIDSYVVSGFSPSHTHVRTDIDAIDQVVATYFPAPASYTGDDVVELSAHGSPVVLRGIVTAAMDGGARLAEPGEFTLRAFLNGRIDLMQAEAVADLVDAVTPLQARAAFDQLQGTLTRAIGEIDAALFDLIARLEASVDFPEEGYHFADPLALVGSIDLLIARSASLLSGARRGRLVREGFQIAIVGKPNVGKSSLFNALVGASRAIVTDIPGTTRDLVTELVDLDGVRVTLVDTAGLRATRDIVEVEGVERARRAQSVSDLILVVLDRSHPLDDADRDIVSQTVEFKRLIVENKADLPAAWNSVSKEENQAVSATTGVGLDALRRRIAKALDIEPLTDRPEITNIRHTVLLHREHESHVRAPT